MNLRVSYDDTVCVSLELLIRAANFVAACIFEYVYVIMGPLLFQCLFLQYVWEQMDRFKN